MRALVKASSRVELKGRRIHSYTRTGQTRMTGDSEDIHQYIKCHLDKVLREAQWLRRTTYNGCQKKECIVLNLRGIVALQDVLNRKLRVLQPL
jgi:hypothetical protein